jgi:hypothetical protein
MSELDRHLDVYDDRQLGYPRRVPIGQEDRLLLPYSSKPTLKEGDLVTWYKQNGWWVDRFGENPVGLVLDSRWVLMDWGSQGTLQDYRKWTYTPEAAILWSNGELTNSSHGALKKVRSRSKR